MKRVAPWVVGAWWAALGIWTVVALLLNNLEATSSVQTAAIADFLPMTWSLGFCTGHWLSPRRRMPYITSGFAFVIGAAFALWMWFALPSPYGWWKTALGAVAYFAGAFAWPIPPRSS